jgi:5'-methylthioadenosine phosphorylase
VAAGQLGLVVGSGLTVGELSVDAREREVAVGAVSVVVRETDDVVAVARHGGGVPAHRVDHEANLRALVECDVDRVLAVASTGSLRPDWPVGTVVVPDDFFAPWVTPSIFDDMRGHSVPGFDRAWRATVTEAWHTHADDPVVDGGVYVQTLGPRFETPAEIRFYAGVGDVIGMTVAAECVLAAELGMAYAAICVVDNLANGLEDQLLTEEAFRRGVATNRERFTRNVNQVTHALRHRRVDR